MMHSRILFLVEMALFAALGTLLSLPYLSIPLWMQGGSISFVMVPIFIMAFRWGLQGGLISGLLIGFFNSLISLFVVSPFQYILDYPLAFTVVGFAGVFSSLAKQSIAKQNVKRFILWVTSGVLVGSTLRFICHFASGIIYIDEFMPDGVPGSVWMYSLTYNLGYMLPSFIISSIVLSLITYKQPRFLLKEKNQPKNNHV